MTIFCILCLLKNIKKLVIYYYYNPDALSMLLSKIVLVWYIFTEISKNEELKKLFIQQLLLLAFTWLCAYITSMIVMCLSCYWNYQINYLNIYIMNLIKKYCKDDDNNNNKYK